MSNSNSQPYKGNKQIFFSYFNKFFTFSNSTTFESLKNKFTEHFTSNKLECYEMLKMVNQLLFLNLLDLKTRLLVFYLFQKHQGVSTQKNQTFSVTTGLVLNLLKQPSSENERYFIWSTLENKIDYSKHKICDIEENIFFVEEVSLYTYSLEKIISSLEAMIVAHERMLALDQLIYNLIDMSHKNTVYKLHNSHLPDKLSQFVNAPKEMIKQNNLEVLEKELLRKISFSKYDLLRPIPQVAPLKDDIFNELELCNPELPCEQEWNPNYELAIINKEVLLSLIAAACERPLENEDIDVILTYMERKATNVVSNVTASQFMLLVDQNQRLASGILLKLFTTKHAKVQIEALCQHPTNIHSMEVVNNLVTNQDKLPKEFLQIFISNCICDIERMEDSENKKRLIRVLCHFLKNLIHNDVIDVNSKIIEFEINTFCFEYANINEAQYLFKQIKQRKDAHEKAKEE